MLEFYSVSRIDALLIKAQFWWTMQTCNTYEWHSAAEKLQWACERACSHGDQQKCYKDTLKSNIKRCNLAPKDLESSAFNRTDQRSSCRIQSLSLKQIVSHHLKLSGCNRRQGQPKHFRLPMRYLWASMLIQDSTVRASLHTLNFLSWPKICWVDGSLTVKSVYKCLCVIVIIVCLY